MHCLTCPLSELSPALQARTLYQHTVFGIARYLTSPAELPLARHPLDFAFLLGLGSKVRWYAQSPQLWHDSVTANLLLGWASNNWRRGIHDFDGNMLAMRFAALSQDLRDKALWDINHRLEGSSMKELDTILNSKLPQEVYHRLDMSLSALEKALKEKDPMMPQHLRNSHAVLVSYPETVNLLRDEEIAILIDAAEIHTQTEIVKAVAKGKGKSDAGIKKLSVNDL